MGPGSEARSISEKQHDWGVFCVFSISRLAKRIYSCADGLLTTGSLFARLSAEALDMDFQL